MQFRRLSNVLCKGILSGVVKGVLIATTHLEHENQALQRNQMDAVAAHFERRLQEQQQQQHRQNDTLPASGSGQIDAALDVGISGDGAAAGAAAAAAAAIGGGGARCSDLGNRTASAATIAVLLGDFNLCARRAGPLYGTLQSALASINTLTIPNPNPNPDPSASTTNTNAASSSLDDAGGEGGM